MSNETESKSPKTLVSFLKEQWLPITAVGVGAGYVARWRRARRRNRRIT